jgi:hypothetical protein
MKKLTFILTIPLMLWSCGSEQKSPEKETEVKKDSLPILYEFIETTDPNFCSLDSIEGGDCNGGNLYLGKNGKAVYEFFCYDSERDTVGVSVGDYKMEGDKIICDFKSELYTRIKDSLGNYKEEDYKKGWKEENKWSLILEKMDCKHKYIYKSPYTAEQIKAGGVYGTGLIFSVDTIGVVEEWEKIIR